MNQGQIVDQIYMANSGKLTRSEVREIVTAIFDAIATEVSCGGSVMISAFGTFTPIERAARMGRNPRTGTPLPLTSRKTLRFKPSPLLIAHLG